MYGYGVLAAEFQPVERYWSCDPVGYNYMSNCLQTTAFGGKVIATGPWGEALFECSRGSHCSRRR